MSVQNDTCIYIYMHMYICIRIDTYTYISIYIYIYLHLYLYLYLHMDICTNFHAHVSLFYRCDICVRCFYMTRARKLSLGQGVSAAAIRLTQTLCGISRHVVTSSPFRGPGLRTPTFWQLGLKSTQGLGVRMNSSERLRFHRLVRLPATPMWTLQPLVLGSMTEAYPKC